jgi:hypothetical protein
MLQIHTIARPLLKLLKDLQQESIFKDYFLVGGTALSLQLGHRMSEDIDLFTNGDFNKEEIFNFLNKNYKGKYVLDNVQNSILNTHIDNLKVDFVGIETNLIEDVKVEDGIKYLGIKDIAAMKLRACAFRGDEAKDFVDVYYLLKEMNIKDMFDYFKKKYDQTDITIIKKSLIYFDDVKDSSWKSLKLLHDKLSANDLKQTLINEVDYYNKNHDINVNPLV